MTTFKEFCNLCELLENDNLLKLSNKNHYSRLKEHITNWIELSFRKNNVPLFVWVSLLLAAEEVDRKYHMQQKKLSELVCRIFGFNISSKEFELIGRWDQSFSETDLSAGDFALRLEMVRNISGFSDRILTEKDITLVEVNELLDKLAKFCPFSHERYKSLVFIETQEEILRQLLFSCDAKETKWLIRIILKDMKLNLKIRQLFYLVHPSMNVVYLLRNNLLLCCKEIEPVLRNGLIEVAIQPEPFMPIAIAECEKAHGTDDARNRMINKKVLLETKYDGERLQVHISSGDANYEKWPTRLKIFNKSGRESTFERRGCHFLIFESFGECMNDPDFNCIVEGEILTYDERSKKIEEFERIRLLEAGQESNEFKQGLVHYLIVWYDLLYWRSQSFLTRTTLERRNWLKDHISFRTNYIQLSEARLLNFANDDSIEIFRQYYEDICVKRYEGLIIKPIDEPYSPRKKIWLKLKKDYIPGLADTAEFLIIGGKYSKRTTSGFTLGQNRVGGIFDTFFVACKMSKQRTPKKPFYKVVFDVSAGLTETELHNFFEKSIPNHVDPRNESILSYDLDFYRSLVKRNQISVYFRLPYIFELKGSSFVKPPGCGFYVLRFPVIIKQQKGNYEDAMDYETLQSTAQKALQEADQDEREVLTYHLSASDKKMFQSTNSSSVKYTHTEINISKNLMIDAPNDEIVTVEKYFYIHFTRDVELKSMWASKAAEILTKEGYNRLHSLTAFKETLNAKVPYYKNLLFVSENGYNSEAFSEYLKSLGETKENALILKYDALKQVSDNQKWLNDDFLKAFTFK